MTDMRLEERIDRDDTPVRRAPSEVARERDIGLELRERPAPPPSPPSGAGGRRGLRLVLGALMVAALVAAAGYWLVDRWSHVYVKDSRIAAHVITLGSEVTGRVTAVPVVAGDRVAKGDLIVAIDSRQARHRLEELDAGIAGIGSRQDQLRAQQDLVRRQVASRLAAGEAEVKAAQAEHRAAVAGLEAARSDYQRLASLRKSGAVAVQQLEEGRARFLTAQQQELRAAAGIDSARAALVVIQAQGDEVAVLDRQIAALDAEKAALQARRAQQQVDLEDREVRAAFDGVIDATFVEVGEHVAPGSRLVLYHDPARVWVDANVKETEFHRLKVGASARITVDAYPGREFRGEVARLGHAATSEFALLPTPNPSGNFTKVTQRLPVRISIAQDGGAAQDAELLRPGMMVEVAIDVGD